MIVFEKQKSLKFLKKKQGKEGEKLSITHSRFEIKIRIYLYTAKVKDCFYLFKITYECCKALAPAVFLRSFIYIGERYFAKSLNALLNRLSKFSSSPFLYPSSY